MCVLINIFICRYEQEGNPAAGAVGAGRGQEEPEG